MEYSGKVIRVKRSGMCFLRYASADGSDIFAHYSEFPGGVLPPAGTVVGFRIGKFKDKAVARDISIVNIPDFEGAVTNVEQ